MQVLHAIACGTHAAALIMDNRYKSINAIKFGQDFAIRLFGNCAAHCCGTVHAGNNANVIAGCCAAISPQIAHEGPRLVVSAWGRGSHWRTSFQQIMIKSQIVTVNVIARFDIDSRFANGLCIFDDRLALGDRNEGNLVARVNFLPRNDTTGQGFSGRNCRNGDGNIVSRG